MTLLSDVRFRRGDGADALCIGVLATQVFLDTYAGDGIRPDLAREVLAGYSPEAFAVRVADAHTTFVLAERAAHLIGFAEIVRERPCPAPGPRTAGDDVELVRLYVARVFQRRGVGKALLARAEEAAAGVGAQTFWLTAWSGNEQALAFYRASGYDVRGTARHFVEGQAYENQLLAKAL